MEPMPQPEVQLPSEQVFSVPITSAPVSVYAGFWLRVLAWLMDTIICIVLIFAVGMILFAIDFLMKSGLAESRDTGSLIVNTALVLVFLLYYIFMESSEWQATLGKRLLSIKVTDYNGGRISFARACGRTFARILSGFLLIGYIMVAFTKRKQGLHDMLAGTLVVKD